LDGNADGVPDRHGHSDGQPKCVPDGFDQSDSDSNLDLDTNSIVHGHFQPERITDGYRNPNRDADPVGDLVRHAYGQS